MDRKEIIQALENASSDLNDVNLDEIEIVVIGGAALIMSKITDRVTIDIDCFWLFKGDLKGFADPGRSILYAYDINSEAYDAMDELNACLAFNNDHNLLFEFEKIKVYVPIIEQLILSKVLSVITRDSSHESKKKLQDGDDLRLLLKEEYNRELLDNLAKKWIDKIAKTQPTWSGQFSKLYKEYTK